MTLNPFEIRLVNRVSLEHIVNRGAKPSAEMVLMLFANSTCFAITIWHSTPALCLPSLDSVRGHRTWQGLDLFVCIGIETVISRELGKMSPSVMSRIGCGVRCH